MINKKITLNKAKGLHRETEGKVVAREEDEVTWNELLFKIKQEVRRQNPMCECDPYTLKGPKHSVRTAYK